MKRHHVDSSVVFAIGYDPVKKTLEVELHSHDIYDYLKVPEEQYLKFLNADSKGKYYNFFIKPYYAYKHIRKAKSRSK